MGRTGRKRKRKVGLKEENVNVSASDPNKELLKWMKTVGDWKPNRSLQLTEFVPLRLRGFMAKCCVEPSDVLIRIPFKLLITRKVAVSFIEESKVIQDDVHFPNIMTFELLVIFLLLNKKSAKAKNTSCQFWKPYMNSLPDSYEVPYFCKDGEVNLQ